MSNSEIFCSFDISYNFRSNSFTKFHLLSLAAFAASILAFFPSSGLASDGIINKKEDWIITKSTSAISVSLLQYTSPTMVRTDVMGVGRVALVISCNGENLSVQTRDFKPAQSFPQPVLSFKTGDVIQTRSPDARIVGAGSALEVSFPISRSVMTSKAALKYIRNEASISIYFNGKNVSYGPLSAENAEVFSENCLKLWDLPN